MNKKLLLIGWDAADWKVIDELMADGKMPTLKGMIERGTSGNLRTLQPPLSPMLWTSIATGKRPFKHGIYGFTEPTPNRDGVQPMTNASRSSKALWNILNQHDRRSVVVGWWPSHPAEPIRGAMVSDLFHKVPQKPSDPWPLKRNAIHPPERVAEVAPLRVHPAEMGAADLLPFVPDGKEIDQTADSRLSPIMKITAECATVHATATHLLEAEDWDFAAIYYDAIDHYSHGFMKYRAPQKKKIDDQDFKLYRHVVDTGYVFHDMMLKQLLEYTDEDTTVMLISDHGFHPDHLRPEVIPNEPAGPAKEHRDYGIFVATGPNIRAGHSIQGANLLDIAPTVLTCYGLPTGEDMDGRVLADIFTDCPTLETIESWELVEGETGEHPEGFTISAEESEEALEQLVALGYIDPPEEDSGAAVANCERELEYNLARAYMDADLHGEAAPRLLELYRAYPMEFRFGIQLAACLRTLDDDRNLLALLRDMSDRWRKYAALAAEKSADFDKLKAARLEHWEALKKVEDEITDPEVDKMARVDPRGNPVLFKDHEQHVLRKIQSLAKGNPRSLDFLASTAAAGTGDFENALALVNRTRATHAGDPTFHVHRGNILISLDRLEEAEKSLKAGLAIDDLNPKCLMGLARCYVAMERYAEALDAAEKAVGLQHQFTLAHYFRGLAHRGLGDFESAISALNQAIGQNPNFEEAHAALADIHESALFDAALSNTHRRAAEHLAAANRLKTEQSPLIEFETKSIEELATHLPSIKEETSNPDFEPSLEQNPVSAKHLPGDEMKDRAEVVVVSGLPRSGTSMMMQMLAAGGVPIFTDGERVADESNPRGYHEVDLAKGLARNNRWMHDCDGQAVKVVTPLIRHLPQAIDYKVIHMRRPIEEIVRSQARMLERLDEKRSDMADERMGRIMRNDTHAAMSMLRFHGHEVLTLDYADVLADPLKAAAAITKFLGRALEESSMGRAVDPSLHREKTLAPPEPREP